MSKVYKSLVISGYRFLKEVETGQHLHLHLRPLKGRVACKHRGSLQLRSKGGYLRSVRHLEVLSKTTWLKVHCRRWLCRSCSRSFVEPLPGILPGRQSSEPYRHKIYTLHHAGIPSSSLSRLERVGAATVSRIYSQFTQRKAKERIAQTAPRILGIDEHTLHKKKRFATTFCDLRRHRVFDVAPGKSTQDLEGFLNSLQAKHQVRVVCTDLSASYRSLVRHHFPRALLVADRFHVVRVVMHHFCQLAREWVPALGLHRGRMGLLRKATRKLTPVERSRREALFEKHPLLKIVHHQMHAWRALLNKKHQSKASCRRLAVRFLEGIQTLEQSGFAPMQTLAKTLTSWKEEIARMWRFTRNNGITEGFHRTMKLIQRRAYGFRNFENYRLRVLATCG
jgi:transposase